MATVIDFAAITKQAETYQNDLRFLPYAMLSEVLAQHGINLKQVAYKDIVTNAERKGGLIKPYSVGMTIEDTDEILKFNERTLEVHKAHLSMEENILSYRSAAILNNPQAGTGINQNKEHPLKDLIISNVVKTMTEDILDAMFFMERDTTDKSPFGIADGYFTIMDKDIVAGDISVAKQNLVATGAISAPSTGTDTAAFDKVVEFVRAGNPFLLKMPSILVMNFATYNNVVDAYSNKIRYFSGDIGKETIERAINAKCNSKVTIVVSHYVGTGDRIFQSVPGNMDFGMNTFGDEAFIEVSRIKKDRNIVNYWAQFDVGARINNIHAKVFKVNDRTNTASQLSGDYLS